MEEVLSNLILIIVFLTLKAVVLFGGHTFIQRVKKEEYSLLRVYKTLFNNKGIFTLLSEATYSKSGFKVH